MHDRADDAAASDGPSADVAAALQSPTSGQVDLEQGSPDQQEHSDQPPVDDSPPVVSPRRSTFIDRLTWTARQRRGMTVLLAVVIAVLGWRAIRNPAFVADPQPARPARSDALADQLDPNVATWQELAAIPSLGERRAKAIVEHRADWQKRHPGGTAYEQPLDLAAVSGIGGTMIEQMTPHLMFPTMAATRPAE